MVEYVSRAELSSLGLESLTENLAKVAKAEARSSVNATFLSHSSRDDDVMPAVVRILEGHGASVYLDKKDGDLLSKSPKDIAETLRNRIVNCKKFVVFASVSIRDSKWVPWELGLADGYKKPKNVCLFPAPESASEYRWTEQEYLGIYDRIVWGTFKQKDRPEWMVWNHKENTATALREWLTR